MNGRRARQIRRTADAICREQNITDHGAGYQPQTVRNRAGHIVKRFPEVRLMPGPRYLARRIRSIYTQTGVFPVVDLAAAAAEDESGS